MSNLENKYWGVLENENLLSRYHNFRERVIRKSLDVNCDPQSSLDKLTFEKYQEFLMNNNKVSFSYTIFPSHFTSNQFYGTDECEEIKTVTFEIEL